MSNPKAWGKGGGKHFSYDKGKGKGYGQADPWRFYNPFRSKGKGEGQGGNGQMGFAKGGEGTYMMEQDGYPTPATLTTAGQKHGMNSNQKSNCSTLVSHRCPL